MAHRTASPLVNRLRGRGIRPPMPPFGGGGRRPNPLPYRFHPFDPNLAAILGLPVFPGPPAGGPGGGFPLGGLIPPHGRPVLPPGPMPVDQWTPKFSALAPLGAVVQPSQTHGGFGGGYPEPPFGLGGLVPRTF